MKDYETMIAEKEDEIEALHNELARLERYKTYSETANELFAIKQAFVDEGFTDKEAMQLLTNLIKANMG